MNADEVVREYAQALGRGEPETAFGFFAETVVMHVPGRGRMAGSHEGKAAVVAAFRAVLTRSDSAVVTVEVQDRLASETSVALLVHEKVTRGEETLDFRRVNLYRVHGGAITSIDIFEANQYEVDAFFG